MTGISTSPQQLVYDACLERYGGQHQYLAMIDADEVCGSFHQLARPLCPVQRSMRSSKLTLALALRAVLRSDGQAAGRPDHAGPAS